MAISTTSTSLIDFANAVTALANAGFSREQINAMLGDTPTIASEPTPAPKTRTRKAAPKVTRASKPKQTTPTPKPTPARKAADVKAAKNMVEISDGRMMNADPKTATKGQIKRNTDFATKHGFIVEDFAAMSMADAAEWLIDAKTQI